MSKTAELWSVGQYSVNVATPSGGITVTATTPLITNENGKTAEIQIVLETAPTADVVIPISSSNTGEGAVSANSFIFTSSNWNIPQVVTVTGVADGVADDDVAYLVTLGPAVSLDPEYDGLDPADLPAVPTLITTSTGFAYWAEYGSDLVRRSPLDGSTVKRSSISRASSAERAATISHGHRRRCPAGRHVLVRLHCGNIYRANLDGSDLQTLFPDLPMSAGSPSMSPPARSTGPIQRQK